jgi:hypothetical protein
MIAQYITESVLAFWYLQLCVHKELGLTYHQHPKAKFEGKGLRSLRPYLCIVITILALQIWETRASIAEVASPEKPELVLQTGHPGSGMKVVFSPDGRLLASIERFQEKNLPFRRELRRCDTPKL